MKRLSLIFLGLLVLAGGAFTYIFFFPEVLMLTDRCSQCGRSRIYSQCEGVRFGSTIYNLKIELPGDTSPTHHHDYTDPKYTRIGRFPRWKMHPDGLQTQ